jgi:AcrR family transcriptional regulator
MLDAFVLQSGDRHDRVQAPPVLVFEAVPLAGRVKGQLMFHGLGVITKAELVVQRDEKSKATFPNYVFDIALLDLAVENEELNWEWINSRRNPQVSLEDSLKLAPTSWQKWVESGPASVSRLRRNVITRSVVTEKMQKPPKGSAEEIILSTIYSYYDSKKHRFEALAEFVAQEIFREQGVAYKSGWITQGGGDGGFDFVGSIDLDPFGSLKSSRQVVLGQAKCEKVTSATNGLHIARLAARLRRGWVGVYVTTSYFSVPVQREVLMDRYPVVLIDGARVASVVRKYLLDHGVELVDLLDDLSEQYEDRIGFGDPDSVLA